MKKSLLLCVASSGLALAFAAHAQQAGEYDGQTADGLPMQILVKKDPLSGKLEVSAVAFNYSLLCQKSGDTRGEGWAIYLADGGDIVKGKFSYAIEYSNDYLPFSMTFKGKDKVSGETALTEPNFNPAYGYSVPPKKMQLCSSDQPFTATFAGARKMQTGKPGTVVIRSKNVTTVAPIKRR
jgi:hypothetical protein